MDPLILSISQQLESLHDDLFKAVEPLSDAEINWAHPRLTNTVGILLRHVAGSERYWIREIVGGQPVRRNRDAEFVKDNPTKVPLIDNLRRAHAEVQDVLRSLTAADLAAVIEIPWDKQHRRVTKAWVILHSVEHTAYHLGQIQLFKKMAT